MDNKLKFAGMLAGGYLLGRTRKMKTALMLAATVGAKQLRDSPSRELTELRNSVLGSPEVKRLTGEVSGRLTEAGKAAAIATATRSVESLSTNLQERTEKLQAESPSRRQPEGSDEEGEPTDGGAAEESSGQGEEPASEEPSGQGEEPASEEPVDEGEEPASEKPADEGEPTDGGATDEPVDEGEPTDGGATDEPVDEGEAPSAQESDQPQSGRGEGATS
ncbi:hypothetical protein GCM10023169_28380 [Georgenia halophila]|uniref:DNA primase n=1 Tax=Georgenia halophila TaxID=620889 RepID=A0ABP8LFE4_9MICO